MARARDCYARETELRMKALTEELEALVLTQTGRTDELWSQLREQEEASRQAGFAGIAPLPTNAGLLEGSPGKRLGTVGGGRPRMAV